jgi:hypothetical protein
MSEVRTNDWGMYKMTAVTEKMTEACAKWLQYLQNLCRNISTSLSILTSAVNVGEWLAFCSGHFKPGETRPEATEQKAAWDLQPIGTEQWRNIFAPLTNLTPFCNPMPDGRIQTITPPTFTQNHTTPTTYFTLILPKLCAILTSFPVVLLNICVCLTQLLKGRYTTTSFGVAALRATPNPVKPTTCVLCSLLAPV